MKLEYIVFKIRIAKLQSGQYTERQVTQPMIILSLKYYSKTTVTYDVVGVFVKMRIIGKWQRKHRRKSAQEIVHLIAGEVSWACGWMWKTSEINE